MDLKEAGGNHKGREDVVRPVPGVCRQISFYLPLLKIWLSGGTTVTVREAELTILRTEKQMGRPDYHLLHRSLIESKGAWLTRF